MCLLTKSEQVRQQKRGELFSNSWFVRFKLKFRLGQGWRTTDPRVTVRPTSWNSMIYLIFRNLRHFRKNSGNSKWIRRENVFFCFFNFYLEFCPKIKILVLIKSEDFFFSLHLEFWPKFEPMVHLMVTFIKLSIFLPFYDKGWPSLV